MPVSRVSCRYPGPRESVHIKLLVSPVSFSIDIIAYMPGHSIYTEYKLLQGVSPPLQSHKVSKKHGMV